MAWDEFWKAVPPIVQAISVAVTAFFAVKSLNAWRAQLLGKRRFEVAEETILAVYRAKEALDWIRNPGAWSGEAAERPKSSDETESDARNRDTFFVPLKRIKETAEQFAELGKIHALCRAHFGQKAADAINEFFRVRTEVSIAAGMLMDQVGTHRDERNFEFTQDMRWTIWGSGGPKDKLAPRIAAAVKQIEDICGPYLK